MQVIAMAQLEGGSAVTTQRLPVNVEKKPKIIQKRRSPMHRRYGNNRAAPGGDACLSVVQLGRVRPLLVLLLVILHAFQSLPGEVFEHDVVVTSGRHEAGAL